MERRVKNSKCMGGECERKVFPISKALLGAMLESDYYYY